MSFKLNMRLFSSNGMFIVTDRVDCLVRIFQFTHSIVPFLWALCGGLFSGCFSFYAEMKGRVSLWAHDLSHSLCLRSTWRSFLFSFWALIDALIGDWSKTPAAFLLVNSDPVDLVRSTLPLSLDLSLWLLPSSSSQGWFDGIELPHPFDLMYLSHIEHTQNP